MVKKLAAYAVIAAGATAVMLTAGPAQATEQPAPVPGPAAASPYGYQGAEALNGHGSPAYSSKKVKVKVKKKTETNNFLPINICRNNIPVLNVVPIIVEDALSAAKKPVKCNAGNTQNSN